MPVKCVGVTDCSSTTRRSSDTVLLGVAEQSPGATDGCSPSEERTVADVVPDVPNEFVTQVVPDPPLTSLALHHSRRSRSTTHVARAPPLTSLALRIQPTPRVPSSTLRQPRSPSQRSSPLTAFGYHDQRRANGRRVRVEAANPDVPLPAVRARR